MPTRLALILSLAFAVDRLVAYGDLPGVLAVGAWWGVGVVALVQLAVVIVADAKRGTRTAKTLASMTPSDRVALRNAMKRQEATGFPYPPSTPGAVVRGAPTRDR